MSFQPDNITENHILQAVSRIESDKIDLKGATKYHVLINNKAYPPKEVMRYAHEEMNGEHLWEYSGGEATNKFLRNLGFKITKRDLLTSSDKENINYWVFQGNPKVYDFEAALKSNGIADWTVSAHKDKIKEGDKIIIWLTGNKAGCYALAEVLTEPYENSREDPNWKEKQKNIYKADIEITHNLFKNPITHDEMDSIKELENLNVGHQGTNFSATKEEYETILDLIDSGDENAYNKVKSELDPDRLSEFLTLLRNFVKSNNISPSDERISFNVRPKKNRLVFLIGGRYALNIEKTEMSFISEKQLSENSTPFTNINKEVEAYWNVVDSIEGFTEDIIQGFELELRRGHRSRFKKYANQDFINDIYQSQVLSKEETQVMNNSLNTILYGPPGTGKTYNTINKALEIIGEDLTGLSRKEIKQLYKEKIEEGQIVFTTFHQSMSYEDFVEGIKPQAPDKIGDPLIFEVEDGIFKQISIDAINSIADASKSKDTQEILNFSESFDKYLEEIEKQLSNEKDITITTKNGGKVIIESISQQGNLLARHPGKELTYPVSKMRLSKLNKAFPDLAEIKNIDREFREVIGGSNATINWAVLNDIRDKIRIDEQPPSTENRTKEDKTQIFENFKEQEIIENEGDPFVLIIDEINRGNVSQIFGELITLIEDDKRLGKSESLRIKLPYSKSIFGVPPNLHIIGTMNTADRSVEALDTALRRRFAFKEMAPNVDVIEPAVIDGVQLRTLLSTINNRIEKLIDKDHKIGHSYFINIKSTEELKLVFKDKVIPLLEEYFFGDFGKIGLVLGDSFIMKNEEEDFKFASFEGYDDYTADDLKRRATYAIKDPAKWNFKSIYEIPNK